MKYVFGIILGLFFFSFSANACPGTCVAVNPAVNGHSCIEQYCAVSGQAPNYRTDCDNRYPCGHPPGGTSGSSGSGSGSGGFVSCQSEGAGAGATCTSQTGGTPCAQGKTCQTGIYGCGCR